MPISQLNCSRNSFSSAEVTVAAIMLVAYCVGNLSKSQVYASLPPADQAITASQSAHKHSARKVRRRTRLSRQATDQHFYRWAAIFPSPRHGVWVFHAWKRCPCNHLETQHSGKQASPGVHGGKPERQSRRIRRPYRSVSAFARYTFQFTDGKMWMLLSRENKTFLYIS